MEKQSIVKEATFVLVAVKGKTHQPVKEGIVTIVQAERTKLQSSASWTGWIFQIRTPAGYKAVPILPKDYKKKKAQYIPFSRERKINWTPHND